MFRRVWVLVLAGVILIGLWIGLTLLLPHPPSFKPIFLAHAMDSPIQGSHLSNAPFQRALGPNSSQNLGTVGVAYHDYLMASSYDAVEKAAKAELRGIGWRMYYSGPEDPPIGKFIPASRMDALFLRENDAVTIYRIPMEGKVRVRVWRRTPSIFNGG